MAGFYEDSENYDYTLSAKEEADKAQAAADTAVAVAAQVAAQTASNVGGGNGTVFKQKNGEDFEFRTLVGGGGNTVTTDGDVITITAPSSSGGDPTWTIVATSQAVTSGSAIMVDSSGATVVLTFPSSPVANDVIRVATYPGGSDYFEVNTQGVNVNGASDGGGNWYNNYIPESYELTYIDASAGWVITKAFALADWQLGV